MAAPTTVDEYIAGLPEDVQPTLQSVRRAIHAGVPGAEERIRYGMPAVMLGHRYAIHFAGWKHHVGLYPVPTLEGALEAEVAPFRKAKDSVNFRYRDGVPLELVQRMAAAVAVVRRG